MASPSLSPHFVNVQHVHTSDVVPTLRHHSSANAFYDVGTHSRGSSRPSSSSSSNSSYASPASAHYTDSPASSYAPPSRSASWSSLSAESCPPSYSTCTGNLRRPRPLPTPPRTPQYGRVSQGLPPRPLPRPPLERSHSDILPPHRSTPLPTPPTAPAPPPVVASPSSPQSVKEPKAGTSAPASPPVPKVVVAPSSKAVGRPSIQVDIPGSAKKSSTSAPQIVLEFTPLSPIAFNFPGPRDLRKRREDELSRRMKDLGFVEEAPPPPPPKDTRTISKSTRHTPECSISSGASDDDREVVLLMECSSDSETEEPPTRSESRAAMLTLFPDADCTPSPIEPRPRVSNEVAVDVQVEVVMKKAVARTKRRVSRKWVREKSGKRWTEKDFSEIISELRKLR
ncbi:hypothetical protein GY45DRAFT_1282255 [Cubamyces sp. BRFM 1775]|nr:hypothetical protein GY45DRAFT_1282255 [Cubamyces sp. BRFM 1775]